MTIYQDLDLEINKYENTGFKLWDGSYLLKSDFIFEPAYWYGKKVIELGSGLVRWSALMLSATVIATDLPEVLPHTKICIMKNVENISSTLNVEFRNISVEDYS